MIRLILDTISGVGKVPFYFFASLLSIVGFFCLFISDARSVFIALVFFCLMLLVFTSYLIYVLFKVIHIKNRDQKCESKSIYVKFDAREKTKIEFNVYKVIQCKVPFFSEMDYPFKWSGSKLPEVYSNLQKVISVVDEKDPNKYDKAILSFKRPLQYNESRVVHFGARMDDSDLKSSPLLSNKILNEVDVIHYHVHLRYKLARFNKPAVLRRKKFNTEIQRDFEVLEEIPFNQSTKTYEYHLLNPEVGYIYELLWER
jgi:hypothetical protein